MALLSLAMGCSGFLYSGEQSAMLDIANNFAGTLMGIINALGWYNSLVSLVERIIVLLVPAYAIKNVCLLDDDSR